LCDLVAVRVEAANAGEENLSVDSKTASHLHQLSYLL